MGLLHMVQNPPYWMAKECSRLEHKGFQPVNLDFPLFPMSSMADFLPCDQLVQKAHTICDDRIMFNQWKVHRILNCFIFDIFNC